MAISAMKFNLVDSEHVKIRSGKNHKMKLDSAVMIANELIYFSGFIQCHSSTIDSINIYQRLADFTDSFIY